MKSFTKFFCALALCVLGVMSANAATEQVVHECDYTFQTSYPWYKMGQPEGSSFDVADGVLLITNTVEQANNYDLQPFVDDNITTIAGGEYKIRLTLKATASGKATIAMGTWSASKAGDIEMTAGDEFNTYEVTLKEFPVDANNVHILFQCGKYIGEVRIQKVQVIYMVPDDPLAKPKKDLTDAINAAKMQNPFAKTEDSFAALAGAIEAGEAALAADDATEESLNAAIEAVKAAIDGLVLVEGYTKLTKEMFKHWNDNYNPTEGTAVNCAYDLFKATGQPYGDGNVNYLNFADISEYDKLIVIVTDGTPRIMMNRLEVGNGGGDGNGGSYVQITDAPVEGIVTVDLTKYDYAHLNAIKGANWANVTVTDMLLYKASDPLELPKTDLQAAIDAAKLVSAVGKTEESFQALQDAIAAAETALAAEDATVESLTEAKNAVTAAVEAIDLAVGYSYLTADMFLAHKEQGGEGTATGCAFDINKSTGMPYGDGNVFWLNYADLSGFDKLVVVATAGAPRFCMNRTENNAQATDDAETSKFIDIPGKTWATEAYETVEGNVYTIDLAKLVVDRGIAYLHSIKGVGGASVTVSDMLLYKTPVADGIETVKAAQQADAIYNIAGQRVEKAQKGLYIIGGRKVIVK